MMSPGDSRTSSGRTRTVPRSSGTSGGHEHARNVSVAIRQLRLHELDIQSNNYLLTNQNAAGFKRCIPGQPEIFAVDAGGG